jgi:hypothetical protein
MPPADHTSYCSLALPALSRFIFKPLACKPAPHQHGADLLCSSSLPAPQSKHQLLIPLAMVHWGEEAPKSASSIIKEPPPTPLPPAPHTPDLNLQLLTDWQNRPLPQAGAAKQHKEEKSKHKDRSKASKEKGKDGGGTATTAGVEAARVPGHKDQAGVKVRVEQMGIDNVLPCDCHAGHQQRLCWQSFCC